MSHHHMLPPIIYTPQPKPKKIESRKSRVTLRATGGVKSASETEETEETEETFGSPAVTCHPPPDHFAPVEGSEQKPWSTSGRLSEETLKTMLQVQEQSG